MREYVMYVDYVMLGKSKTEDRERNLDFGFRIWNLPNSDRKYRIYDSKFWR